MNRIRLLAACAAMVCAGAIAIGGAHAQPVRGENIESELVAATDAVVPGQPLRAGLRLKHDPKWHTYWIVPGDSGLATQIRWTLPEGWRAGPIEWPVPLRLPVGPLMNFGYEGEVLLAVDLVPPESLQPGDLAHLAARADWLICKDVCIPGGADLKLVLPVRAQAAASRHAPLFAAARERVPQPLELKDGTAVIDGQRVRLQFAAPGAVKSLAFFPLEEGRIEPAAPQLLRSEGALTALYLTAAQPVSAQFRSLRGVLVANDGPGRPGGWAGVIEVPLAAGAVAGVAAATSVAPASNMTLWAALIGAFIGGVILNLMPCVFPVLSLKLLSLMQHQRAEDEAHLPHPPLALHGALFTAGVVASFVLLAAALIALRAGGAQLGWGFQLQAPWVVAALTLLFFLIGLNLLGAFEVTLGGALASSDLAQRLQSDRLSGSFWTGVLAVVVASPCTAPFMGAALGYAVAQPAAEALLVFAVLGVGMATPYLLLTLAPRLLARLPRPGAWMERFRQVMAFPMFLACVWLIWVLAQQVDVDAVGLVLIALVLVGLAAWAFGLAQRGRRPWRWVAAATSLVALYAVGVATGPWADSAPVSAAAPRAGSAEAMWQPWSAAAVEQAVSEGRPVFVDFTAAWCVTCQANKRLVLHSAPVQQAFAAKGVVAMRADWTNRDPAITQELARYNRTGVPLYVLFDGRGGSVVLPELLTERMVLDALRRL
jgi:thiol:disulfide interchange protein/DsbC/DsbD-like thiol-disulfide interchange protein